MSRSRTVALRRVGQALWDAFAWTAAVPFALILRYDAAPPNGSLLRALTFGLICAVVQVALGYLFLLYRGRYRFGSFDEVLGLALIAGSISIVGMAVVTFVEGTVLPRSVPIIAGAIALGIMLGGRFALRAWRERRAIRRPGTRTLIYGAGESGDQLVRQMLGDEGSEYVPVGFLDDDPGKTNLRIHGIKVLGTGADLEDALQRSSTEVLIVAMAGVDARRLLDLDRRCQPLKVKMRVIPTTSEIVGGAIKLGDISEVTEEDLLGRRPIATDEGAIAGFLAGKRILITGAGGSIGSELARQVHRYSPDFVGMLDRDESALHAVQLTIDGRGLLTDEGLILADIRDPNRMVEVMEHVRPDIVFHAAALKHLTLLERFPEEARKTNVEGTRHVLAAAQQARVSAFINISTDKAADPTSVLGTSKLKTEQMTASMNSSDRAGRPSRYLSVRFGNVIGSRGSVLNAFRYQIAHGGPVTVTHPDATRYFMTVTEAVHLVLQASVIGEHGETLILDMGEPVRIADVAREMIDRSGRRIEIVYTGLRPGEKLDETLFSVHEVSERRKHPLISHTRVTG